MKDFILLIMAGITVFTLSLIAYSKWEKHVAYKAEYTELRQEVNRQDKSILATGIRIDEMEKTMVRYFNKSKGGRR